MKRIGPGRYQVTTLEGITVEIKKSVGQWLVAVSEMDNATWNPEPDDGTTGGFQAPKKDGDKASFTVLFNFTPGGDWAGDFYSVTIRGTTGDADTTFVDAPALQHRTYFFTVKA